MPELGRTIDATDKLPGHDSVVVISHALWQSMFAEKKDVLTKSLQLDGRSYRIIGVMPGDFQYPHNTDIPYLDPRIGATQLWVPLVLSPQQKANRDDSGGWVIARLRQGVSVEQAELSWHEYCPARSTARPFDARFSGSAETVSPSSQSGRPP